VTLLRKIPQTATKSLTEEQAVRGCQNFNVSRSQRNSTTWACLNILFDHLTGTKEASKYAKYFADKIESTIDFYEEGATFFFQ
jgi:hypothetical protein